MLSLFQTYQKSLSFLISRDPVIKVSRARTYFDVFKYIFVIGYCFFSNVAVIIFLFTGCETLQDYSNVGFSLVTLLIMMNILVNFVWKRTQIFELIDNLEDIIKRRELSQRILILINGY